MCVLKARAGKSWGLISTRGLETMPAHDDACIAVEGSDLNLQSEGTCPQDTRIDCLPAHALFNRHGTD